MAALPVTGSSPYSRLYFHTCYSEINTHLTSSPPFNPELFDDFSGWHPSPSESSLIEKKKKKKAMADRGVNKFAGNSITVLYFVLGGEWEGTEWHGLGCPKQNKTKNNPLAPK